MDERTVLAQFDRLVEQGTVVYNDNYRIVQMSDKGFPVRVAGGAQPPTIFSEPSFNF